MLGIESSKDLKKADLFDSLFQSIDQQFKEEAEISRYRVYQDNPVGFGETILNEYYTDEVKAVMRSVRDNVVTVAQSANAVGKSHCAARIAAWWYKVYPDSQVYMSAAPPEANLRRILWAHVLDITEKHPKLFKNDTVSNLNVNRSAMSFLVGVTIPSSGSEAAREAKFAGKHAPYLLFIVDEGDAVPSGAICSRKVG